MAKYIIIYEDGEIYKTNDISQELLDSWSSGMFDIIRVYDQKVYNGVNNKWIDINIWDG